MSNLDDDFDFDGTDEGQNGGGPADLRKALRQAQKQLKEANDRLADLSGKERTRTVQQVLQEQGAKAGLARYVPSDVADADGVVKWLEAEGELFGWNKPSGDSTDQADASQKDSTKEPSGAAAPENAGIPTGLQALWQQMQATERAGETALPPEQALGQLEAMRNAGSFDKAVAISQGG